MSHFNVLVFTEGKPDEARLHEILAPWHESECTGVNDQYVQDIDITEEARTQYEKDTERRFKDPEGNLHDPYKDEETFYRQVTPEEKEAEPWARTKKLQLPEGWEDVKVPSKTAKTFIEWIEDWYDYRPVTDQQVRIETKIVDGEPKLETIVINNSVNWDNIKHGYVLTHVGDGYVPPKERNVLKVIKRTNPNAKWDWWQIGGRYANKFSAVKVEDNPNNWEDCSLCGGSGMRNDALGLAQRERDPNYTCNGCEGKGRKLKWPTAWETTGDQAHLASLNYEVLKEKAMKGREDWIKSIHESTNKRMHKNYTLEQVNKALQLNKSAHEEWMKLPEPRPRGNEYANRLRSIDSDHAILADVWQANFDLPTIKPGLSVQDWINEAPAIQCFAVVKDGKWYEKGEMGWWAIVVNKKDEDEWNKQLNALLQNLIKV